MIVFVLHQIGINILLVFLGPIVLIFSHCEFYILDRFVNYNFCNVFIMLGTVHKISRDILWKFNAYASSTSCLIQLQAVWPDWAIYWTLGYFLKPLATINLPKSPTFLGNFCKGVKIYHFSSWNHFGATLIDIWRFFSGHTGCKLQRWNVEATEAKKIFST